MPSRCNRAVAVLVRNNWEARRLPVRLQVHGSRRVWWVAHMQGRTQMMPPNALVKWDAHVLATLPCARPLALRQTNFWQGTTDELTRR